MSLLLTKPKWHRGPIIATERGWVNETTKEVLVSIGNLKSRLEAEHPNQNDVATELPEIFEKLIVPEISTEPVVPAEAPEIPVFIIEAPVVEEKEVKMELQEKKKLVIKKLKVVGEVVEANPSKQIIAEVVEYDLEKNVIAE